MGRQSPGRFACLAISIPLCFGLAGCERSASEEPVVEVPRHIFFITVDTLRADHLGVYGYPRETSPNLDRLASQGVRFERAIVQWPKTTPSFASMFTGRYPQSTGMTHRAAKWLADEYRTLAEMVQGAGFWTAAVVSNPVLSSDLGWNQGFDEYHETWRVEEDLGADPVRYRTVVNAERVNELARPVLEQAIERDRTFIWLHYSDPHAPYILPPGWENPFVGDPFDVQNESVEKIPKAARIDSHDRLGFYLAQYDANIRVADQMIGSVLDFAADLGLLEDSLVVFTSDHGEAMGEHQDYFRHGAFSYNTEAHVPLFFLAPGAGEGGRTFDLPVELIDLYPTLAELVGGEAPTDLEGKTLVPILQDIESAAGIDPREFGYAYTEAGQPMVMRSYYRSVQDRRWKLIFHPPVSHPKKGQAPALIELYDLDQDPLEQQNLAGQHERDFNRLWGSLTTWMAEGGGDVTEMGEGEGHDEETLEALRALGYLD